MDIFSNRRVLKRLMLLLTFLNLILLGLFVWNYFSAEQSERKEVDRTELFVMLKNELGLTDTQVESLKSIRNAFFEKESILSKDTRAKRDSMNLLMFSAISNDTALKSLAAGVSANEHQMELLRIEQSNQLRTLLNVEQIKKMEKLVREIRDYLKPEEKRGSPNK